MSKNNKGFITIELIVVSVFVLAIFSIIFINSNLAFQSYEKKEFYDDIDTKYAGFYVKKFISSSWETDVKKNALSDVKAGNKVVYKFTCDKLNTNKEECKKIFEALEIKNIYITRYSLKTFKEYTRRYDVGEETNNHLQIVTNTNNVIDDNDIVYMSSKMYDYIKQSPDYINNNNKDEIQYRLFIELEYKYNNKTYNKYGTMELGI